MRQHRTVPLRIPSPPSASKAIYNPVELNLEGLADVVIWGAGWEIWVHHCVLADRLGVAVFLLTQIRQSVLKLRSQQVTIALTPGQAGKDRKSVV